jgi:hypothetical protein
MARIVRYVAGEAEIPVEFEIEPPDGFQQAGLGEVAARVGDAVEPAVAAARDVLHRFKELHPDEVEVTFGIKVSGSANWLVAKGTGEGNFAVTLRWRDRERGSQTSNPDGTELPQPATPGAVASAAAVPAATDPGGAAGSPAEPGSAATSRPDA